MFSVFHTEYITVLVKNLRSDFDLSCCSVCVCVCVYVSVCVRERVCVSRMKREKTPRSKGLSGTVGLEVD